MNNIWLHRLLCDSDFPERLRQVLKTAGTQRKQVMAQARKINKNSINNKFMKTLLQVLWMLTMLYEETRKRLSIDFRIQAAMNVV